MTRRELAVWIVLAVCAGLIVVGVACWSAPAALIVAGTLGAALTIGVVLDPQGGDRR